MFSKLAVVCASEADGCLRESVGRRYGVHPFHCDRENSQRFLTFYNSIREHEKKFFDYYRMSRSSFDELLNIIRPHVTKQNTHMRNPISAEERLTITLRYLAIGTNFAALQFEFYIARSTIAAIVRSTCRAVWSCLQELEMPEPTTEMWLEIADTFFRKTNFPNCAGAVDGKHIRCRNPKKRGTLFYNYKKYFSLVLLAVADANLRFVAIDVGAYGKEGDSTVFRDSPLGKKLYSGTLNLPKPRCLPNTTNEQPQPFVFVRDEAFKINKNLLRPFPSRDLNSRRRIFNYRLSRCRRSVECAFGLLANKWRIFHTPLLVEPDFVDDIIKSCCILHNFVRKRDGINVEYSETYPFEDVNNAGTGEQQNEGRTVRDVFADYFVGDGAVDFQRRYL